MASRARERSCFRAFCFLFLVVKEGRRTTVWKRWEKEGGGGRRSESCARSNQRRRTQKREALPTPAASGGRGFTQLETRRPRTRRPRCKCGSVQREMRYKDPCVILPRSLRILLNYLLTTELPSGPGPGLSHEVVCTGKA